MNSGKSTELLRSAYQYEEKGMSVLLMKPKIDTKGGDMVVSRLGVSRKADVLIKPQDSVKSALGKWAVDCVFVDEAQFVTPNQAEEFFWYAVEEDVPVMTFGLRTDFQTRGFPGATRLLELAHSIDEIKTICQCGVKAVLNGRKEDGQFVHEGSQVAIDDSARIDYEPLCGNDYRKLVLPAEI